MRIRDHLRQLASESAIYGLPSVVSRAISLFLVPVYTRVFAPADYGVMSMVDVTVALLLPLVVLGLDSASYRWYYDTEDTADRKNTLSSWFWTQTITSTLAGFLLVLVAPWLIRIFIHETSYFIIFVLCAVSLPVRVPISVLMRFFRLQHQPVNSIIFSISQLVLTPVLTILFVVVLRKGILGIYLADLIVQTLAMGVSVIILRNWISPLNFQFSRLRQMLTYSLPLIPTSIAAWVVSISDRYIVSLYRDLSEVGLYQLGISIASAINIIIIAFHTAWVVFALSIKDKPEANQIYAVVMEIFLLVACFIALGITLFAPEALQVLTTPAFYPAYNVVGMLTLGFIFTELYQIFAIGLSIEKKMAPVGIAFSIGAGVNLLLNFVLIPYMGRMGAAAATLIAQAVIPAYVYYSAQKVHPVPYRLWVVFLVPLLAFLLMTTGQLLSFLPAHSWILVKILLLGCFIFSGLILEPVRIYLFSLFGSRRYGKRLI